MRTRLKVVGKRLRRPRYADVVATLALFIALGGVSYAAVQIPKNSVGAKQLKKNAVTAKKIKKNAVNSGKVKDGSLLAKDFKAGQLLAGEKGPQGPVGAIGPEGPRGEPGETGPVGPSTTAAVMGRTAGDVSPPLTTLYLSPSGTSTPVTDRSQVAMRSPAVEVTLAALQMWVSNAPGPGNTWEFNFMVDGNSVGGCNIANYETACSFPQPAVIPPNSELAIRARAPGLGGGGAAFNPAMFQFGYTLGP